MSIVIRDQRDVDGSAVDALLAAAFGDGDRVPALARALRGRADLGAAMVAEDGTGVIGTVQLSTGWVDAPHHLVDVLVLSPLGVLPSRHRQGIGRALLAAATERAERLGAPMVFLEGDPAYYGPKGWRRAGDLGFTAPSARIPDPAFQVVTLATYDAAVTGALVYNDTFWEHDCVGLR